MAKESESVGDAVQAADAPQHVDWNFGMTLERIDGWIDGAARLLPNIVAAAIVVIVAYFLSVLIQRLVQRHARRRSRANLGLMLGGLAKWATFLGGFLFAATIIFPTLHPGDLIAGLGVSSIAIGFAFKDILQNWLAGLLILLRQPFEIGDQIEVNGYEGTVERIETRATIIKTYDGQRVVMPNNDIYTHALLVKTAHEKRRSEYDVGVGYGDGIDTACEVIRAALAAVPEVEKEPQPEALPWDLAASWVTIRVRWWTGSHRVDVVYAHAAVIKAIKQALDAANIDMPYDTQVQLFHDQTESTDGDRRAQREGWPAPDGQATTPRWQAQVKPAEDSTEPRK